MKRTTYGGAFGHIGRVAAHTSPSAEPVDADRNILAEAAAVALAALIKPEMLAIVAAQLQRDGDEREAEIVQALDRPAPYMELLDILLHRLGDAAVIDMMRRRVDTGRMKALVMRRPERNRGAPKSHPVSDQLLIWLVEITRQAGAMGIQPACKLIAECAAEVGGVHLQRSLDGRVRSYRSYTAIRAAYNRAVAGDGRARALKSPGFEEIIAKKVGQLAGNEGALRHWLLRTLRRWSRNRPSPRVR
jgi:hypothetical protein